ncbi:hypothetical protein B0T24DRAFT_183728 [Lasiosphaeria ovina]|uniref:Secreted protein n=1 Tax=Lasiosphaeria ovina TaxID=92902 RepID=A0AAE0NEQ0_9PEZI|nr:hypothetical protein B0T24DRAFT_183728 [Lasiosphaeria ovina]
MRCLLSFFVCLAASSELESAVAAAQTELCPSFTHAHPSLPSRLSVYLALLAWVQVFSTPYGYLLILLFSVSRTHGNPQQSERGKDRPLGRTDITVCFPHSLEPKQTSGDRAHTRHMRGCMCVPIYCTIFVQHTPSPSIHRVLLPKVGELR